MFSLIMVTTTISSHFLLPASIYTSPPPLLNEGEGGDVGPEDEGGGGGDGGDEVNDGNDGNDGEDDKGGNAGPEDEPSTAARVATEIRAAVKGRRAE